MKRTMRKWFYFDGSDAKTAEAWLNRLGAACWGLAALAWLVLEWCRDRPACKIRI